MIHHAYHTIQTHIWDSSKPQKYDQVSLRDYKQDWQLTEAFNNPRTHLENNTGITAKTRFSIKPSAIGKELSEQDAIIIRRTLDKSKVAWLLILLLVLSPGLGVVVGFCTHKAEVGLAMSAGIFALASFLQGLAEWFHTR